MKRTGIILSVLLLLILLPTVRAEDVNVSSSVDKRAVHVNEEIHMTLRIEGALGNIQAPRLPNLKNMDTFYTGRASHITFINNQSSSRVEFSYVLVPKAAGKFVLNPVEVSVGSQQFKTDPIEIDVLPDTGQTAGGNFGRPQGGTAFGQTQNSWQPPAQSAAGQNFDPFTGRPFGGAARSAPSSASTSAPASGAPPIQEPPRTFQPGDDNVFVRAWLDKTSVYPNEQVVLTYSLYTRYDTRYEGFEDEPQTSGFWIEEFPQERDIQKETVRMNGKRYVKADIKKVALFPTAPSDYTIQPGSLKVSIRQEPESSSMFDEFFNDSFFSGGGFFSRRENRLLKPPPLALAVKPFPKEGQPENFQGAVGNFIMTATMDKPSVKQNEPVTLKIVIEGQGNIETLNKPKIPEDAAFKIYDADTSSQLFKNGDVIGGKKTFEIVFIPNKAGRVNLPVLEFSFFNPAAVRYTTLKTPQFTLDVAASTQQFQLPANLGGQDLFKKDIQLEGRDIHFIWERLADETAHTIFTWAARFFLAGDLLLTCAILFGLWHKREETIFARDKSLRRRKLARPQAESRMKHLKKLSRSKTPEATAAYFEEAEKILTQYLSGKFDLSAYGMTRNELEHALEQNLGASDELYQDLLEFYRICDESRFAKANIPEDLKEKAYEILRLAISRVERMRRS